MKLTLADGDRILLEEDGWIIGHTSPLHLIHEDGSIATGTAAQYVIYYLQLEASLKVDDY